MKRKKGKRRRVKFQIRAEAGSRVSVAGTFNGWDPDAHVLKPKGDGFALNILLEPGRYSYKFIVNGVWCVDPENQEWEPNDCGSMNSVVTVE